MISTLPYRLRARVQSKFLGMSMLWVAAVLCCASCNTTLTQDEALRWIADVENGLSDTATVGEYVLRTTVVPSFVSSSRVVNAASSIDSSYVCIRAVVSRSERTGQQDVLLDGATSHQQFAQRLEGVAFLLHDDMMLKLAGGREVTGVDTSFEQNLGLGDRRIMHVTFPISEREFSQAESATLVWTDRYFGAGRIEFDFKPPAIQELVECL